MPALAAPAVPAAQEDPVVEFDQASYDRAVETVRSHLDQLPGYLAQVRSTAVSAANGPGVPGPVATAVMDVANTVERSVDEIISVVEECLEGVAAPVVMISYAQRWIALRGVATTAQGVLRPDQLPVRSRWKGPAADRYAASVTTQSLAAGRVAGTAYTTAGTLTACAVAGLLFYVALGAILVRLVAAMITAIGALGSEVFSWAGLLLAVEEAGVAYGLITGAVASLTALIGAQVVTINSLNNDLVDQSAFPAGRWPKATADTYSDATVLDGTADWSVVP